MLTYGGMARLSGPEWLTGLNIKMLYHKWSPFSVLKLPLVCLQVIYNWYIVTTLHYTVTRCCCVDKAAKTADSDSAVRYEQLQSERRSLPVHRARRSLLQQLRQLHGSTAIVIGETGSGKTTQIPQVHSISSPCEKKYRACWFRFSLEYSVCVF